jgi:hypothetical protein
MPILMRVTLKCGHSEEKDCDATADTTLTAEPGMTGDCYSTGKFEFDTGRLTLPEGWTWAWGGLDVRCSNHGDQPKPRRAP